MLWKVSCSVDPSFGSSSSHLCGFAVATYTVAGATWCPQEAETFIPHWNTENVALALGIFSAFEASKASSPPSYAEGVLSLRLLSSIAVEKQTKPWVILAIPSKFCDILCLIWCWTRDTPSATELEIVRRSKQHQPMWYQDENAWIHLNHWPAIYPPCHWNLRMPWDGDILSYVPGISHWFPEIHGNPPHSIGDYHKVTPHGG